MQQAPPAPPPTALSAQGPAPQSHPVSGIRTDMTGARRALAGFLVSYQDDPMGKWWPLWQGKNSVGRADTGQKVEIEIAHGTTSTHHATIECDPQRFVLSDLGSTNGTFHNEEAIGFQGKRELRDGDKVRFGGYSVMIVNVVSRT
jgi:cold shock CspA family protein